jgi:PAS domain S-box-containing protein
VSDFESEVYRADGSTIWIAEFARTVFNENREPLYYEGSVIDISAYKRVEFALKQNEEKFRILVETTNVVPVGG